MMVAIPGAVVVQGYDKQVTPLHLRQDRLARHTDHRRSMWHVVGSGDPKHCITQRFAPAVKDGGLKQEGLDVSRLTRENFGGQIIHDIAVSAAKGADEAGAVVMIA